jgi:hypothetical protein
MNAAAIAAALGGHRVGNGYLVRCPVSGHGKGIGDRRPSLFICDGDRRLLTRCFAGCNPSDVVAAFRDRGFLDDAPRGAVGGAARPVSRTFPPTAPTLLAGRLWCGAGPIAGSVAERYLTMHRDLSGPFPASLRFATRRPPPPAAAEVPGSDCRRSVPRPAHCSGAGDLAVAGRKQGAARHTPLDLWHDRRRRRPPWRRDRDGRSGRGRRGCPRSVATVATVASVASVASVVLGVPRRSADAPRLYPRRRP